MKSPRTQINAVLSNDQMKNPVNSIKKASFKNGLVGLVALSLLVLASTDLIAQVSIGGTDASGQMKDVQTLITTVQNIGFKWVAPLIGSGLAIIGIFQIATRRLGVGILALGGGGALFAVEKIATSLSHITGGGN